MNVMHLWAIGIGAAALALPIAIHVLTKPRPTRFDISTFRFLAGAIQEHRARHRLRDFVILALRTAAIALVAAAFARPFFSSDTVSAPAESATRVVLVDSSQSMAATEGGISCFERARGEAADLLQYRPGLAANLILASARPEATFMMPSTNFSALRDSLSRASVAATALDVNLALAAAAKMFPEAPGQRKDLVIISDFQRSSWSLADFSVVPADVTVTFQSVAPRKPLANVALASATVRARATAEQGVTVEIEVINHSSTDRSVDVDVELGDIVRRIQGSCEAFARSVLTTEIPPPPGEWHWGQATLAGNSDALAADDVLPLVARIRGAATMALVTRQSPRLRPSSSYYLTTAIAPTDPKQSKDLSRLRRVDPARQAPETATNADGMVFVRPGLLEDEWIAQVVAAARRGRTIFYVAEEATDATNLVRLAEAAGRDWKFPVDFAPSSASRRTSPLAIAEMKTDRQPFSVFAESAATILAPLEFRGGLMTTPRPDALADDVLARYSDRTACLAIGNVGIGKIAVLNADLQASELAQSEAFVPILGELFDGLFAATRSATVVRCGEPITAYLPLDGSPAGELEIHGPEAASLGRLRDEPLGVFWETPPTRVPGVYRVTHDAATVFATAATIPSSESDLRPLSEEVLVGRLAGGRTTVYRADTSGQEPAHRWWVWLLAICAAAMLLEIFALKTFRT